jgi:hypothetical protein
MIIFIIIIFPNFLLEVLQKRLSVIVQIILSFFTHWFDVLPLLGNPIELVQCGLSGIMQFTIL